MNKTTTLKDVWKEFDSLKKTPSVSLPPSNEGRFLCRNPKCSALTTTMVLHEADGDMVCPECGWCEPGNRMEDFTDTERYDGQDKSYKRRYYFAEKIAAMVLQDPAIPPVILDLVEAAYLSDENRCEPDELDRRGVQKLLAKTVVPEHIRYQYRSKKTNRPLNVRIYCEKYRQIKNHLGGFVYIPPKEVTDRLQEDFKLMAPSHEVHRHKPECDGGNKCHTVVGCRHNLGPYDNIIGFLLKKNFPDIYETYYEKEFPVSEKYELPLTPLNQSIFLVEQ